MLPVVLKHRSLSWCIEFTKKNNTIDGLILYKGSGLFYGINQNLFDVICGMESGLNIYLRITLNNPLAQAFAFARVVFLKYKA